MKEADTTGRRPVSSLSAKKVRRGLRLFASLTVIGLVFVLYRSSFRESIDSLSGFA